MASRLSAYLHPLAGRPLCWHVLCALSRLDPAPARLVLAAAELPLELAPGVDAELAGSAAAAVAALPQGLDGVLLVDAAAPTLDRELAELLDAGPGVRLTVAGRTAALFLAEADARELLGSDPHPLAGPHAGRETLADPDHAPLVHDRAALARAVAVMRDRLVRQQMLAGVTFLLPESVLLDVDVSIGRDTIVYPGVVLEGNTTVGIETVIGPGCRIVDSWIGSGVELKGWNYIARTSVRNRAILEPYVRRGFE
jgi:bifunctional N-acetylglucosamine-1-phosphate-uridyltransferase/glucosamine-1-phosphate-acetyltransferase GlmU-like protein